MNIYIINNKLIPSRSQCQDYLLHRIVTLSWILVVVTGLYGALAYVLVTVVLSLGAGCRRWVSTMRMAGDAVVLMARREDGDAHEWVGRVLDGCLVRGRGAGGKGVEVWEEARFSL